MSGMHITSRLILHPWNQLPWHLLLLLLVNKMAIGYDPKASNVVPNYVVKTTGDPFFVTAYPEPYDKAKSLAECKKLSPKGVEQVAT